MSPRAAESAVAVIPAGGVGARMGSRRPKQYLSIGGAPILVHTVRALLAATRLDGMVVAVPAHLIDASRRLLLRHRIRTAVDVVSGGAHRQESVWRGLQAVPPGIRWVLVHDAVRPFVTAALLDRLLAAARRSGAATCGLPVRETVKRVRGDAVESTLDRDGLWLIQTPQVFSRELLWEAHDKARRDGFSGTDDASLVERLGGTVAVVPGLPQNIKITTRDDLKTARLWRAGRRRGAPS